MGVEPTKALLCVLTFKENIGHFSCSICNLHYGGKPVSSISSNVLFMTMGQFAPQFDDAGLPTCNRVRREPQGDHGGGTGRREEQKT